VKDEGLRPLYERARRLSAGFAHPPKFVHVRRAQNSRADELCNLALDGLWQRSAPDAAEASQPAVPAPPKEETIHDRAIALLSGAAEVWAQGDATNPPPEEVWRRLWEMVEREAVTPSDRVP